MNKKSSEAQSCDFLIVGGGIIGTAIATTLRQRKSDSRITIIEKESQIAYHASGRNSGILHAGFYYSADSLKAKFTKEGCLRLTQYCQEKSLPLLNCGKLVVAQSDADLPQVDELLRRAKLNKVELHEISEKEAYELEPNVKFHERILWSPKTSVVNPQMIVASMVKELRESGVQFLLNTAYISRESSQKILSNSGPIQFKYLINCSGLYADKIALDFGFSKKFRILPFKGMYLKSEKPYPGFLKRHIYPVPNLNNPFLGVHFTLTVDGYVKIGPTAIPALWREQYNGTERFSCSEFFEIVSRELGLISNADFNFRALALEEFKKYSKKYLTSQASNLVQQIDKNHFSKWGPTGIRAQLLNIETKKLEMDYICEGDSESFHVLNAISPAFTSSLPFAEYICDQIESHLHGKMLD